MDNQQHPFAQFIRTIGRGKKGAYSLTQDEAYKAMGMIIDGHIEPEQLGAFLMLMRVKEETPAEVAGFVRAARERIQLPGNLPVVDLDWSSYAGKRRHLPWFILSVLLLVDSGVKVFMHGLAGRKDNRIYTPTALSALGLPISTSLRDAANKIQDTGFAYLNLDKLSPRLQQFIDLREILGLRSPVHTVSRMLNPFQAPCLMQGIFHPGYLEIHQGAARLLEQPHTAVIKGDGGEIECNPDMDCQLYSVHGGEASQEEWPAILNQRQLKPQTLDISNLGKVWRGEQTDTYGQAAVISTLAVTLYTMRKAANHKEAISIAKSMWADRSHDLI
jgi:anthranilate phosphoribosyltransferase